MAGAGYKLFNTGDVLTAAQVNTYLMQQSVMVFANSAARTTALSGVLAEGMLSYLQDTNAVEKYDGSSWGAIGAGDIEGVTVTSPLTGGGTSGTVTVGIQNASTSQSGAVQLSDSTSTTSSSLAATSTAVKSAYDLAAANTLPSQTGNSGKYLTTNGSAASWGTVATPPTGWTLLNAGGTTLTGAATVTVSSISAKQIMVLINNCVSTAVSSSIRLRFNGNTSANYLNYGAGQTYSGTYASGNFTKYSNADASLPIGTTSDNVTSQVSGYCFVDCVDQTGSKAFHSAGSGSAAGGNNHQGRFFGGILTLGAAITSVSVNTDSGSLNGGTLYIYGAN